MTSLYSTDALGFSSRRFKKAPFSIKCITISRSSSYRLWRKLDIDSKKKGTQGGTDDSPELEYHILVISKKDTFIAMTLQKNLKDNGFEVSHSVPNVQEISEFRDTCNIFIFYMDEGSAVERDTLVYLKDLSMEEEKMVILIGTQDEFRVATWILPKENLAAWFLRPFDMRGCEGTGIS